MSGNFRNMNDFEKILFDQKEVFVLENSINKTSYVKIDLSANNYSIENLTDKPIEFEKYIEKYVAENNSKVAFGGYLEKRNLYKRSTIFENLSDNRNIHLGIDLWIKAETSVLAALDGEVFSVKDNIGIGNYGPTIILKHQIDEYTFYTLYGHLSQKSVENLVMGRFIKKGTKIATLGNYIENGDYAPHLHFQIIKNIENSTGDYAGVCAEKDLDFYKKNCPDPNLLLKL
jgi:murein DD-endopeptidase MepM/ murein hydrolase activator NlpD